MIKRILLLATLVFALAVPGWSGDPIKGQAGYVICVACHGADGTGNVALNSPSIAGQEEWYLIRQIKNFKDGTRGKHPKDIYGMQMAPMSMTLTTDAAVEDVAAYINGLKAHKPEATIKGDAAKGKNHYVLCATCHGPDGKGLLAMNSPNLTIQQDWYLIRQLKNFRDGVRGTDPKDIFGMQMSPMSKTLPDEQALADVAAYVMTLTK